MVRCRRCLLEPSTTTARKLLTPCPISTRRTQREALLTVRRGEKCFAWFSTNELLYEGRAPASSSPSTSLFATYAATSATLASSPLGVSPSHTVHDHPSVVSVEGLALSMRQSVRDYVRRICPARIKLVGILAEAGGDSAGRSDGGTASDAETYAARIEETLREDGIDFELSRCSNQSPEAVESAIRAANVRRDVHGILVFYPIFKRDGTKTAQKKAPYLNQSTGVHYKSHDDYLRDVVDPAKDVEGLSTSAASARFVFRARNPRREARRAAAAAAAAATTKTTTATPATGATADQPPVDVYIPCTALAVLKVLETYAIDHVNHTGWAGTTVTVVNRSEIFGRPLAAVLALRGATVLSVDDRSVLVFREQEDEEGGRTVVVRRPRDSDGSSWTLDACLRRSSIVVTGVPCPHFSLPVPSIAPGTLVVNVSEFPNVDQEELLRSCPEVRLIPHIGKVTVAALEQNLVRLHQQQLESKA